MAISESYYDVFGSKKEIDEARKAADDMVKSIEKMCEAAFEEFSSVRNIIKELSDGTESSVISLGKMATSAALAGAELYAALGPAGLAVAAVTGLVAVITGLKDAQEEAFNATPLGQFSQKINELYEKVTAKSAEIRESLAKMTDGAKDAGAAEANMARDLAEAYEELAGKSRLTAEEQAKLKDISERLVELVPGLNDYIDEQTGCLKIQSETLSLLIDNMVLYAQQQALQGMMTDAYTVHYEAELLKKGADDDYLEAVSVYLNDPNISETVKDLIRNRDIQGLTELKDSIITLNTDLDILEKTFGSQNGSYAYEIEYNVGNAVNKYNQACQEADEITRETGNTIDYLESQYENVTSEIYKSSNAIAENNMQTAEYKQTLSDLKAEFRNMDLNISDQMAESLAFLDEGTLESVTQMFEKLKEQTTLSIEELQQLFSVIAPGISEQFMASLAEQSPEMQLQVSMTLADITAGAEVPIENLQEIFRMLGVDLPNEVISAFQEQEPFMQISA